MRILSHYFIARFVGLFVTVLAAAFIILATIELVLNLDDLSRFAASGSGGDAAVPRDAGVAGLGASLRYLWLRLLSYYLADLLPIASFIATFVVFAWAGRALELVAVQAGGIRLARLVAPVLVTALILSLATALLHETLVLGATRAWANEAESGRDEIEFGRRAFWYHKGRTITNIRYADPETRILHGVEVFERHRSGPIVRVIRSERVRIAQDGTWNVEDATIWSFDPADPSAEPTLDDHVSMALDLDSLGGAALLSADPASLPLAALARYIDASSGATSASDLRRLRSGYHQRLSSPWLVLLFCWLALPFALRVDESGRFAWPAIGAVASLALFFLIRSAGTTLAREAFWPVGLTPWLSMAVFGLGAGLLLRRRAL